MAVKAKIYQLKITLKGSNPSIWRRLQLPSTLTLDLVHDLIQAGMGWRNCHSYAFDHEEASFGEVFPEDDNGLYPAGKVRLNQLLTTVRDKMVYVYDMGDNWEHSVVLEKILPAGEARIVARCTQASGACPPEDCGGLGGYQHLRQALANPRDPDHARLKAWVGGEFDPDFVDTAAINRKLAAL